MHSVPWRSFSGPSGSEGAGGLESSEWPASRKATGDAKDRRGGLTGQGAVPEYQACVRRADPADPAADPVAGPVADPVTDAVPDPVIDPVSGSVEDR